MLDNVQADLNVSGWKIKADNIISSNYGISLIFGLCKSKKITARNWDVTSVTSLSGLFQECSLLEELDISGWTFNSNGGYMVQGFFDGCSSLTTISGVTDWQLNKFDVNNSAFACICRNCTAMGKKLSGGFWDNGTWANDGTFTPAS